MEVQFTINGKEYSVNSSNLSLDTSLNTYIRDHANLRGTKFMCLEGGCGACIVTIKGFHPLTKQYQAWSVNSCLTSVFSCHGWDITTIEGIGDKTNGYHTIQERIVKLNGIQCGYCTPGMIMNMHSLVQKKHGNLTMEEIENSFGGNICRCTGYRPILDAFKSVAIDADPKLKEACKDIEDLKVCPKTGNECSGKCKQVNNIKKGLHLTFADGREWHKVFNLIDIFAILEKSGDRPYMLVAGNTAHGVYRRNSNLEVFIDITGVEELRAHSIGNESIELGGSVSLTEAMAIFDKASKLKSEFEYGQHLIKHIDLIANVPVRNVGTIAGNLVTKNTYNEFPSDLFVIFETVGAKVVLAENGGKISTISLVEFQRVDLKKKVVLKLVFPSIPVTNILRTYKIMPRAQNADAYVNAGFLLELDAGVVKKATVCYGGIDPNFTHAVNAEQYLIGKSLYSNDTLKDVLNILDDEIAPDWVQPAAHPDYRKNLAISLFYKFLLNTAPNDKVNAIVRSGGEILKRPISSGTQNFTAKEENYPLTKPIPRVDGFVQSGGETQYANDLPRQPGELWAAFVVARKANGKLKEINANAALAIPGVKGFFSAKDIPGENNFTQAIYGFDEVEQIFADDVIEFNGQPIGIIVAETNALAHYAAGLVHVTYESENVTEMIYTTIEDVIKANVTKRIRPSAFNHKSTAYGTSNVAKTIKSKGRFGAQYHYTMEPQTCVALPNEEGLTIYASSQWIDLTQGTISKSLKIPMNRIRVEVRRLGGGYGSKISRCNQVACAAALAAYKLNAPVRFVLSIEENMETVGKRDPTYFEYEADVDENGKVQKLTNNYYQDHGYNFNEKIEMNTSVFGKNCYAADAWDINGTMVTTNTPGNTWCRAPGSTEGVAMSETIMEHIAKALGKDSIDVRLANIADDNPIKELLIGFIDTIDYRQRKADIDAFNSANRWTKRGIAVVPLEYPVHYFGMYSAFVTIYQFDGTVAISHGGIEMGQGINTKATQVAAKTLNVPVDKIIIKPSDSFIGANNMVSGGSITSESVCLAVLKACEELNQRLAPIREELKDASWEDITRKASQKEIDLTAKYLYQSTNGMKNYIVNAIIAAEVEVDLLTGNHLMKRVDILEDTGESISPLMDVGQIEGAFIMGMGYWLTEKLTYNSDGLLLNNRTWNYKPPGAKDIPIDFRISFVKNSSNHNFILRSKATGEPPLCASFVVLLAVRNAIDSARKDAGLADEWLEVSAPLTAEDIFLLAGNKRDQFVL